MAHLRRRLEGVNRLLDEALAKQRQLRGVAAPAGVAGTLSASGGDFLRRLQSLEAEAKRRRTQEERETPHLGTVFHI